MRDGHDTIIVSKTYRMMKIFHRIRRKVFMI